MVLSTDPKLVAAAIKRLQSLQTLECMDPINLDSRPTESQSTILRDLGSIGYRYVVAANQCLAEGTLVLTDKGVVPVEDISVGDVVYDENGSPIKVIKTFNNGKKEVISLTNRGQLLVECTPDHQFYAKDIRKKKPIPTDTKVKDFCSYSKIKRVEIKAPLGTINEPHAYALGVFLGDGCCRAIGKVISSNDKEIIYKVASDLGCKNITKSKQGYSWRLKGNPYCSYYDEWCKGRYAHEKYVDLNVIKKWNRESLLKFVAGIIDTDGSIYIDSWNTLVIRLEMQSKSVVEAIQYSFTALWQTTVSLLKCDRTKFVNGPTWTIKCANNAYSKRIVKELSLYIQAPRKKWKKEYSDLVAKRTNSEWIGTKTSTTTRVVNTYDIHVNSTTNLYCLANGLVTHNSGKSQLGSREVSWIFEENHPYWTRPTAWGSEPLLIIVVGRTTKQIEEVLWRKISAFLDKSKYKVQRVGGIIQKITHIENGNTILFASHHNENEAREKLQAFVAHYVWIDEMPGSFTLIEELQRRVQSRDGYFLATFTPKVRNDAIRKLVDAAREPYSRKYNLTMFDNPGLSDERKDAIIHEAASYSESYRNTILYGAWSAGEEAVYSFRQEHKLDPEPRRYSKGWRHVLSVDPAMSSKMGMTLWAEDPDTNVWYCVRAEYLSGIAAPSDYVEAVEAKIRGYNIVRRLTDSEPWYVGAAYKLGYKYSTIYKKSDRKKELIKNLQTSLDEGRIRIASWCEDLVDEFVSCQWSETTPGKIVNSQRFHLIDSCQYFNDMIPKPTTVRIDQSFDERILEAHNRRKEAEARVADNPKRRINRRSTRWKHSQAGSSFRY